MKKKPTKKELAEACLKWAEESRDHDGNPYFYEFVILARKILGEN